MAIESRIRGRKTKKKRVHRIILASLTLATIFALIIFFILYRYIFKPNTITKNNSAVSLFIPTGATFNDVKQILYGRELIVNRQSFEWMASRKNYPGHVKPGHYVITGGMSNNDLVNTLRSGIQTPVRVVFNNIRKKEDLAGKIGLQIEADSASLIKCWQDRDFLKTLNITPEKLLTIFIPNTHEFWWTTDAYEFTRRMYKEYLLFWDEKRMRKAESINMDKYEIAILASIVEKETQKNDEKARIAGVYINRLKKGWPLQADPTVVYAVGDFELKRVLTIHTKIDSPYNTYLYKGLPPGPICLPSIASIDAALNHEKHNYMFFCAKADLSGYHAFSRTLAEHNRYAKAYQNAISK